MLTDDQYLALNVLKEAGGEIPDGQAAIARVTLNRMRLKFFSDGTIAGTVLRKDQFSWAYFDMVNGVYTRVCWTPQEAQARANVLYNSAPSGQIAKCLTIAGAVFAGTYRGTLYDQLTDDAVLYCNPAILTKSPAWAIPSAKVCSIGHHDFYRSVPIAEGLIS